MDDAEAPVGGAETPQRLFFENGATWYWVLAGPVSALAMLLIQITSGIGPQPVVPLAFLVLVSAFVALQIKAARIHTSVELTTETLRQGTETIPVSDIVGVYPAPTNGMRTYYDDRRLNKAAGRSGNALADRALKKAGVDLSDLPEAQRPDSEERKKAETDAAVDNKWQSARALGELTGVPRGRTGIGLKLKGRRTAQAWARRHVALRAALVALVEERDGSTPGDAR